MEITEIRVALREAAGPSGAGAKSGPGGERRLKAYATLTFDHCFVVRNVKVIEGKNGLFVAMPSHKPKMACDRCHFKNDLGGRYCAQCGGALARPADQPAGAGEPGEAPGHRDIAHPITVEFRQYLQQVVLTAYEVERAKGSPAAPTPLPDEPS